MTSRYLNRVDRARTENTRLILEYKEIPFEFQFPPEMTSDGRRINWELNNKAIGFEPWATLAGGSSRDFSLKAEYIVEDLEPFNQTSTSQRIPLVFGGGDRSPWTIQKIKTQVNLLKGYFTGVSRTLNNDQFTMIARLKFGVVGGRGSLTVRINNVSVKYDGPLVGGDDNFYYLKTTVNIDLSTATNLGEGEAATYWQGIDNLPPFERLWY